MSITVCAFISDKNAYDILDEFGVSFGSLERKLYVDLFQRKRKLTEVKREYIYKHQITARQFNSLSYNLKGKVSAIVELKKLEFEKVKKRIKKKKKEIEKLEKKKFKKFTNEDALSLHHAKRKLGRLEARLVKIQKLIEDPSICFGSIALFKAQYNLKANGYSSHEEWLKDWREHRSNIIFCIGSKDETNGNQNCQYKNGKVTLRLPNSCDNKAITFAVNFKQQQLLENAILLKQAVTYRFVKKDRGWYLHATFDRNPVAITSIMNSGMIGIDLNPECIAITVTDRHGNYLKKWSIPIHLKGLRSEQSTAILGDHIAEIVNYALEMKLCSRNETTNRD